MKCSSMPLSSQVRSTYCFSSSNIHETPSIFFLLKLVLAVIITLMLSCSVFAAETNRYVALILDTSGSMGNEPIVVQRAAAKKFCQQILSADGNNKVALISINTTASVMSQFTNDFDELTDKIDDTYADGGTNIHGALKLAGELLDEITTQGAVKNIILCSDGLPEDGEVQYEGHYTYNDSTYYYYANAAYDLAQTLKQKNYNIYTLGFFHSMYGEYLEFGRRFMKDLASNNSYYEVTDVEELEFTFGEIADDVLSGDHSPIIIVPGIMGSRLFSNSTIFNDTTKIWDPVINIEGITKLDDNMKVSNTLYVRPCENQNIDVNDSQNSGNSVVQYGREYGAINAYENLVNRLCEKYPVDSDDYHPVYFFSYDWRKSNTESAASLNQCIQNILDETGANKVDLVCHSMGGLVASKYFQEHSSDQKVNLIVTCGTPYEGSPTLINSVMNWDMLGKGANLFQGETWADLVLGFAGGMQTEIKASFMGVTELLPTKNYVNAIPMWQDSWIPFWGDYQISFEEYQEICREVFSGYNAAYSFQESLKDDAYNALLKYDKSYFILGINQPTITAIKYRFVNNDVDQRLFEDDLKKICGEDIAYNTKGDGTVPYYSASICEQLDNLEESERVFRYDTDHGGVVSKNDCIDWIISKLDSQSSDVQGSNIRTDGYIVVRIACPVDVEISNTGGETLNSSLENFAMQSSFGRLDIIGLSDDIKMLCVNSSPNFSITLNGTDTGSMDYDIRYFDGNDEIYKEDSFRDVPITANTVITTGTDDSKTTVLEIDNDGDGQIDDYLVPDTSKGEINITRQPESQTVKTGESATFSVEASGDNLSYQWNINRHDGNGWTLITGATSSEYSSDPAVVSYNGNEYHCLITNGEGHTVSTNAVSLNVSDSGTKDTGTLSGGGGCEVSSSWALMFILVGIIILTRKNIC